MENRIDIEIFFSSIVRLAVITVVAILMLRSVEKYVDYLTAKNIREVNACLKMNCAGHPSGLLKAGQ